jgi:hypothetical protein
MEEMADPAAAEVTSHMAEQERPPKGTAVETEARIPITGPQKKMTVEAAGVLRNEAT